VLHVAPTCDPPLLVVATSSGKDGDEPEWRAEQEFRTLPPMVLSVQLPPGYPAAAAPSFTLSCFYLDGSALDKLCARLDELWVASEGMPVLYTWHDFLRAEGLAAAGIDTELLLPAAIDPSTTSTLGVEVEESKGGGAEPGGTIRCGRDARARPLFIPPQAAFSRLLDWSRSQELEAFLSSTHTCPVCYEDKLGTQFTRIPGCMHTACNACFEQYLVSAVKEGKVTRLTCIHGGCDVELPRSLLRRHLPDDVYEKYSSFLLQRALDSMGDVVYCPACNTPCIEDSKHFAMCSSCDFAFCALCYDPWHPGEKCMDAEAKLRVLNARKDGHKQSKEEALKLKRMLEAAKSEAEVSRTSQFCPGCSAAISRTRGCNKMKCAYCLTTFCYKCCKVIHDYSHFGADSCPLFDEEEIQRWENAMRGWPDVMVERLGGGVVRREGHGAAGEGRRRRAAGEEGPVVPNCPRCGRQNPKEDRNNHVRCAACRGSYCLHCGKPVEKFGEHFNKARGCPQHS